MLNKEDILHIAKLARLSVSEEEVETYRAQLGSVLEYIDTLQAVNTDGVDELARATTGINVFREDQVEVVGEDTRSRIIEAFPRKQGDLLEVQAVFEDRTE